ncbi:MAG TPA: nicotinate phosphoribosyltransferase, partial [Actinomycetota bacterium]|nr:nicotinate phosphoribosyltransferase [Actinomycetota bacterium]
LATATAVASTAARLKLAADGRRVYSVGLRRVHPAITAVVERAAFIGGCDAVSTPAAAELVGVPPVAATGRDLAVILGDPEAWAAVALDGPPGPTAVAVGGTDGERRAAVAAAEALGGRLDSIRLDLSDPSPEEVVRAVREVRWELDGRGHSSIQLTVCGDLDEDAVRASARFVDGFAVGQRLAAGPAVPLSFDIVEVDGRPAAPRGTLSGRKALWRCERCGNRGIAPIRARPESCPRCGGRLESLLRATLRWGRRESAEEEPAVIRSRALREAADAARATG